MDATIYVVPGSHAARAGLLMLQHKGIPHRRVALKPGLHAFTVRALGFPGRTVPAVKIDGRRVQKNRRIARALDELKPDPPLFPDDPDLLAKVEEAERFADKELQPGARRLAAAAGARDLGELRDHGDSGRLGHLLTARRSRRTMFRLVAKRFGATEEQEEADRAALPEWLDRVDGWIGEGVLNGRQPNAADLQIAPSLALIDYVIELRPQLRGRPAEALIDRLLPERP